jgi:hypothetical protein
MLGVINNHIQVITSILNCKMPGERPAVPVLGETNSIATEILNLHYQLWKHLSFPHETNIREHIFKIFLSIEPVIANISNWTSRDFPQNCTFPAKQKQCYPSVSEQVIWRPLSILDSYTLALQRNFYYPLTMPESTMESPGLAVLPRYQKL